MNDAKWFALMPKGYCEVWTDDLNKNEVTYMRDRITEAYLELDVRNEKPVPSDGQKVVRHLVVDGDLIHKDYSLEPVDEPLPTWVRGPRTFSVFSFELVCFKLGILGKVDEFIDSQTIRNEAGDEMPLRRAYERVTEFVEDSPYFRPFYEAGLAYVGLTPEQGEGILAQCVIM